MNRPIDPGARLRRARRRQSRRLIALVGAMVAVLVLAFVALYRLTAPVTIAERTFRTALGDRIAVRLVERGDRVTARVEVSGPRLRNAAAMGIDLEAGPGRDHRVRIDYDAEASQVLIDVDGGGVTIGVAAGAGGFRFSPVTRPAPVP